MTREEWIKDAQAGIEEAGNHIEKVAFLDNLPEGTKSDLIKSLLGGAVGSAVMGGVGAATADEGENALLRALKYGGLGALGGTAATGAGLAAKDLLMGGRRLEGETGGTRNPVDALTDVTTGAFMGHPLTALGTLGGGIFGAGKAHPRLAEMLPKEVFEKEQIRDIRGLVEDLVKNTKAGYKSSIGTAVAKAPAGKKGKDIYTHFVSRGPQVQGGLKRMLSQAAAYLPGAESRALTGAANVARAGKAGTNYLKSVPKSGSKAWLAALPAAMFLGYAGDRLWRGEND